MLLLFFFRIGSHPLRYLRWRPLDLNELTMYSATTSLKTVYIHETSNYQKPWQLQLLLCPSTWVNMRVALIQYKACKSCWDWAWGNPLLLSLIGVPDFLKRYYHKLRQLLATQQEVLKICLNFLKTATPIPLHVYSLLLFRNNVIV